MQGILPNQSPKAAPSSKKLSMKSFKKGLKNLLAPIPESSSHRLELFEYAVMGQGANRMQL